MADEPSPAQVSPRDERADAAVWGALAIVYVVWGSTYLGIAILVETLPPLLGMASRFGASAVLLGAIMVVAKGISSLVVTRRELLGVSIVGLLLLLGGNGLVALAERYVPSGVVALVIAVTPVWVVVLRLVTGDRPARSTLIGVALGMFGVAALVVTTSESTGSKGFGYQDLAPILILVWTTLVVVGAFSWACGSFLGSIFARTDRLPADPLSMTFWELVAGAVGLMVVGLLRGEAMPPPTDWDTRTTVAWVYLVVAGLAAFWAFTWLIANARISLVATYAFVNPMVAVVLGWWLKDEHLTLAIIGCGTVILLGVILVVRGESTVAEPDASDRIGVAEPHGPERGGGL